MTRSGNSKQVLFAPQRNDRAIPDNLTDTERDALKNLGGLIERISPDLYELAYCIRYKVKLPAGEFRASPRGFEPLYSP